MSVDTGRANRSAALAVASSNAAGGERWAAWQASGVIADARAHRYAQAAMTALLGASSLWVVFEILRGGRLAQ